MASQARRCTYDRVLLDMNTQCDLLLPRGALPVTNRTEILPNICKLMNWVRRESLPMVSSLESHREGECARGLPSYCIDRSAGQRKIPFTLMPRRIMVMGDNTFDVPFETFRRYQQVIFTKRARDFLNNPKVDRFFQSIQLNHLVAFGVVAEHCVKAAVLGLLARQLRVAVVRDACGFWSADDCELAMRQMDAKGAVIVTTDELISGAVDERIRNSRPMIAALDEERAEPAHAGNGNGSHRKEEPAETEPVAAPAQRIYGFGVRSHAPRLREKACDNAAARVRPDAEAARRVRSTPKSKPSGGVA